MEPSEEAITEASTVFRRVMAAHDGGDLAIRVLTADIIRAAYAVDFPEDQGRSADPMDETIAGQDADHA